MRHLATAALTALLLVGYGASSAQPCSFGLEASAGYESFVVTDDAEVRHIEGKVRFCPRPSLKRGVCYVEQRFFKKSYMAPIDWWTPETYAQASTGLQELQVTRLEPAPNGGLVIYFRPGAPAAQQGFP